MAISTASIKYKPLRVGFLVREGQVEDLKKAAGINCVLCGGIFNPIIPIAITGDNSFAKKLVDLFSVDILYPVFESIEIQAFQNEFPYLRDPGHYVERIFYEDWHSKKLISGLLDVKNIYDLLWSRVFSKKTNGHKSNFWLPSWEDSDPLDNVLSLQFGYFPNMNFKWDYKKCFTEGLCAREGNIDIDGQLTLDSKKSFGPIDATACELTGYSTGVRYNGNGLYIGDSDNFYDLLSFWNIRAAGINIVYLAKDYLERGKPFAQSFLDFLNSLPNKHPQIEDRLTIYHKIEDEEVIKSLSIQLFSKKVIGWHLVSKDSWNGMNIQPSYQVFKWQRGSMHIEKAHDRYVANVQLPPKNFLLDGDNFDISNQQMGVIIDPYGGNEYDYPGYTLRLPRIRQLNEFYSREVVFDPWSLRIEHEGFSKMIRANEESISLFPISEQALIEKLLEISGIEAHISQPGLIAKKIIEKIGGLEAARVLKIKGVRKLLQEGGPEAAVTRGQATKVIYKNDFKKHEKLYIEARETPDLTSTAVFDYLLKNNYLRAGLELICEHCRLDNWLSLKNIDDYWLCNYCGGQNQTSPSLKHGGDWKFRKSGLFAKDNHQEGAIPVLLTLLTLKRICDHSDFIYSTALELKGEGVNCEIDLFVMQEKRHNEIEIGMGECKNEGGTITEDDCEKLKTVARKLIKIKDSVDVYLIFSKTNDNFLPSEIELFKKVSADFKVIILTNKELELYHPYWLDGGKIEEDVPVKYPMDLLDLYRNSYARYLKEEPKNKKSPIPAATVLTE